VRLLLDTPVALWSLTAGVTEHLRRLIVDLIRASRRTSSSSIASPAGKSPWTRTVWIYDLRTDKHFTLKTNTLTRADLDDFVTCYNPANVTRELSRSASACSPTKI